MTRRGRPADASPNRVALCLLVVLVTGCTSQKASSSQEPSIDAGDSVTSAWFRHFAYALDGGETLDLRVGDPQDIRASDWSTIAARPLDIVQSTSSGEARMRIWIDEDFQQVRRETDSCIDGVCNVFFDYVAAGTPAPPMLVPHRELADFTWTEEDLRHAATSNASANSVALSRYGTLASRPAGWAWTGWQGTIEYDNQSRPSRIDLTTIMPRTGTPGAWKGTLTRTESPEHWALANGTRHLWAINPNAATPWFPGFDDPVPSRDFTLAEAHQQVLDEYPEAQQANDAACTVKVALGLVDGANSTVTPFDLGSDFFEAQDTLVSFGFPQDDGIAIWAVLRSEADHVRPARYEEGGTAFLLGASPRCDEFGTRAGAVSFYDLAAWAQLAVHGRTADSVHVSWHDTTYHGRLVTGTHLTTSFGPVDPEASVSASFAVVYSPNTARLGGGLMPASWVQALDAGKIPQPTIV